MQFKFPNFEFDHIGIAVASIDNALEMFHVLGFTAISSPFVDAELGVKGVFVSNESGLRIELLEPLIEGQGPLEPWIRRRNGFYQVAFRVDSLIEATNSLMRSENFKQLSGVKHSVWFAPSKVQFFLSPQGFVLEIIGE